MAETCTVDAVLTSTLPVIDHSDAFASLHDLYAAPPLPPPCRHPKRKRSNRSEPSLQPSPRPNPQPRDDAPPVRAIITAPSPLTRPEDEQCAVGAKLIVPADVYPTYTCNENGGWGWSATILTRRWSSAKVSFDRAREPATAAPTRRFGSTPPLSAFGS
eukprot:4601765-Pleurochrysis_carterae.AAC.1